MMNHPPESDNEDIKRGLRKEKESKHLPPLEFNDKDEVPIKKVKEISNSEKKQPQIDLSMKKAIQDAIGRGDLEGAINKLIEFLPEKGKNAGRALKRKWANLRHQKVIGTLDYREESIELSKITNSVLILLDQSFEDSSDESTSHTTNNNGGSNKGSSKRKILFMSANPLDEDRLQVDKEFSLIGSMLSQAGKRDSFELLIPQLSLTIEEFIRSLKQKPNIVHFSGHGLEEGLIISSNENQSKELAIRPLQRQFRKHKDSIQLIILNSCYSAVQAEVLSKLGMYVIGMNAPVGDMAALNFAKGIYVGIGEGESVEDAYIDALTILENENPEYADLPEIWKDGERVEV